MQDLPIAKVLLMWTHTPYSTRDSKMCLHLVTALISTQPELKMQQLLKIQPSDTTWCNTCMDKNWTLFIMAFPSNHCSSDTHTQQVSNISTTSNHTGRTTSYHTMVFSQDSTSEECSRAQKAKTQNTQASKRTSVPHSITSTQELHQ